MQKNNHIFVYDDGRIVGYLSFKLDTHNKLFNIEKSIYINELVVDEEFVNKGYGSKLIKAIIRYAVSEDIHLVTLIPLPIHHKTKNKKELIEWYSKFQFSCADQHTNIYFLKI